MILTCHACGRETEVKPPVGRRDLCSHCDAELRCCLQCRLYDPDSTSKCREPSADLETDRAHANFCEFYQPGSPEADAANEAERAKAAFDALFGKK